MTAASRDTTSQEAWTEAGDSTAVSWIRRLLVIPVVVLPGYWWLTALGAMSAPDFKPPDPVGLERMLPLTAAIALLVPTAVMAALAISPRKQLPPTSRMAPVHRDAPR